MILHHNHNNFPVIDLGNYILREQSQDDLNDFFNYYTDPQVNKHIVADIPRNIEECKYELKYWIDIFKNNDGIYFAIARKDNNQLIGTIGLSGINRMHNRIELSYDLAKEYWNLGITTAAIKAVVKYGFESMRVNRIEAYSLKQNEASRKVLQKCGFELEGELKQHRYHQGIYKDIGIFSLVYSNWCRKIF
jgi:ribosomal-protein-alanine N-acetyltransferase